MLTSCWALNYWSALGAWWVSWLGCLEKQLAPPLTPTCCYGAGWIHVVCSCSCQGPERSPQLSIFQIMVMSPSTPFNPDMPWCFWHKCNVMGLLFISPYLASFFSPILESFCFTEQILKGKPMPSIGKVRCWSQK